MKLAEVYQLPTKNIPVTDYVMSERWIPEVPNWDSYFEFGEVLEGIEQEGLLKINQILFKDYDGERYAAMYSLSFKATPIALIQEAGRGGRDHFNRWITAPDLFNEMCMYLIGKLHLRTPSDVVDAQKEIYPEEIFQFYGNYFGDEFGYPVESKMNGFTVIQNHRGLIPDMPPNYLLVSAFAKYSDVMPIYIRRDAFVMQRVRPVSEEELARNTRVREVSMSENEPNIWWYIPAERPLNMPVLSV